MPAEPKPYWGDKHQPFVKIGTDEKELRALADAIARGASIAHAQIADLRALIEAVQSHPDVTLRPPKDPDAVNKINERVEPTALVIHGGRVDTCGCSYLDIRVPLTAATSFGDEASFNKATFGDEASFARATFGDRAHFSAATFGDKASFDRATFGNEAHFAQATFGDRARFDAVIFGAHASFDNATFGDQASFRGGATFGDQAFFGAATFGRQADFGRATFGDKARFDGVAFGDEAHFDGVTFGEQASFVGRIFGDRTRFDKASFGRQADFGGATFGDQAYLGGMTFGDEASFARATFGHEAHFARTTFGKRADFGGARFGDRASFIDCNLNRASITDAVFDRADLRRTRGILFDETRIAQVQMEGNAPDPWSKLRRKYTGPWFFVNLILVVIFFAPYVANVLALTAAAKLQENMMQYTNAADEKVQTFRREHPISGRVAVDWTNLRGRLSELETNFYVTRDYLPAVWILIGGHKGWHVVVMAMIVMFYNALRAALTLQISALRDAEERSNVTPRLDEYYGLCHPLNDEDGNTLVAGIRTWLRGMWSKRLFAMPNWLRRRLPDDLQRRFSPEQPPSLIACVGLYRVHQLARLIMWIAILATAWNSLEWARETWLWV